MHPCETQDNGICQHRANHCGIEFKYARGIPSVTAGTFFNDLEYISCKNATSMLSQNVELLPDHIDLVHVVLAAAIMIILLLNIVNIVVIQKRPQVKVI